jgi:hypothetical protein
MPERDTASILVARVQKQLAEADLCWLGGKEAERVPDFRI